MISPRALGYRLPAEWEPQQGVWLSWPLNRATWVDCWEAVQNTFAEMALKFSQGESVYINLVESEHLRVDDLLTTAEKKFGLTRGDIRYFDHPTNDAWVRDHGPVYIKNTTSRATALTDWQFNAWGGKYACNLDNLIPRLIHEVTDLPYYPQTLVLEGGSIEPNGVGDLLVTTDCLMNPNRNPGVSKEEIDFHLREILGVEKVHWLDGIVEGDDTDGHIDNLVRFFKPDGILVASQANEADSNFQSLAVLGSQCQSLTLHDGRPVEVIKLPIPEAVYHGGRRLPMSYLNFFIGNGKVFAPVFGQPESDGQALEILRNTFPDRVIEAIDCRNLIREGGALHCLTQQVPLAL